MKMPSHFNPSGSTLALVVALKWSTVCASTSIGTEIMKGMFYSVNLKALTLTFCNSCATLDIEAYTIPHLKGQINAKLDH